MLCALPSVHPMAEYLGMATHRVPFPSWTTMAWQIGLFFFLEDMCVLFLQISLLLFTVELEI